MRKSGKKIREFLEVVGLVHIMLNGTHINLVGDKGNEWNRTSTHDKSETDHCR